ncbi:MAG: acetyl-CoA carboxylase biotin carboxyl carrier protein subunit [Vicinamibacterales bacterium]
MPEPTVTRMGVGIYRVEHQGRLAIVYVAGPPEDRWAFCDGRVYRNRPSLGSGFESRPRTHSEPTLTAPMPATVAKVLVSKGSTVRRGDAVIVLEAMKMELTIRAPRDGVVAAVHCREGDLVQPDRVLVDLAENPTAPI